MPLFTYSDVGEGKVDAVSAVCNLTSNTLNVATGDLIVGFIKWEVVVASQISTITDTIGNTYTFGTKKDNNGSNGEPHAQMFWCLSSIGSNATNDITVTLSNATVAFKMMNVHAVTLSGPVVLDVEAPGGAATTGTAVATGTFSTADAVEYVFAGVSMFSSYTLTSPLVGGNAGTFRADSTVVSAGSFERITAAQVSSGTAAVTQSASDHWVIVAAAFKAATTVNQPLHGKFGKVLQGKF